MFFSRRNALNRAFSLIEAAVVLGIIGLVIGGIWVAAATVNERRNEQEAIAFLTDTLRFMSENRKDFDGAGAGTNYDAGTSLVALSNNLPPGLIYLTGLSLPAGDTSCISGPGYCMAFAYLWNAASSSATIAVRVHFFNSSPTSGFTTRQSLCRRLSTLLLNRTNGVSISAGLPAANWYLVLGGTLITTGMWLSPAAQPNYSTISSHCANARSMVVAGIL